MPSPFFGRLHRRSTQHASVSNTFHAGGKHFLAQDAHAWWWSSCGCWLESHLCKNDGTLFADQVVQSMRLYFFGAVTCVATKGTSLHLCNKMEAELFVDGRLNSCPSNPFMIPAWCVKIAKKTQQPSLERCTIKSEVPLLWPQERR